MTVLVPASLVCLLAAAPLCAQAGRLKIDHLKPLIPKASKVVDVNLDGEALKLASGNLSKDPAAQAVVKDLLGIFVRVLEFEQPGAYGPGDVDPIRRQLQNPAWTPLFQIKDKDAEVGIYLMSREKGGEVALAIFVAEPKQLVVVNVVGPVNLQKLGALEGKLGIPKLGFGKGGSK